NIDTAASDMRDALGRIAHELPEDADASRIIKADSNAQPVMRLAVTSATMSVQDMTVLVEDELVDQLASVAGVADVQVYGERDKIFRIDIDPARLASLGLTVGDVRNALASMAFDAPAGSLTSNTQDLIVRASATVTTPEAFEKIVVKANTRLGDFASVTLGKDLGETQLRANGKTGIGMGVIRAAQSNTLDISTGIREAAERIRQNLPEGVSIDVTSDDATFITGAINEVEIALGIAVSVVLLIIFLFLWDFRATIIPAVAIPVALIGTVAAIYLVGFSINILTLLALVLATGLVVDDAIVVLENIVRRRNQGLGPRAAAVLGTEEVFFAVLATTATLIAVFVPLSFLPGQTGGLFREFGFVLAISVFLSSLVALSLCPMLASRFLRTGGEAQNHGAMGSLGRGLSGLYARMLHVCLDAPLVVVVVSALIAGSAALLYPTIKSELTPREDRSLAFMRVSAPQGVSLDYFAEQMLRIEALLIPLQERGEIESTFSIAGSGGSSNSGFLVMRLAPWDARERSQQDILNEANALVAQVPGVRAFAFQPNSLGIR
ncbi:MAG: efflux RND transporter permease subunit, partial [Nitratireductor sp.]